MTTNTIEAIRAEMTAEWPEFAELAVDVQYAFVRTWLGHHGLIEHTVPVAAPHAVQRFRRHDGAGPFMWTGGFRKMRIYLLRPALGRDLPLFTSAPKTHLSMPQLAGALFRLNRWTGHTSCGVTVGTHSLRVEELTRIHHPAGCKHYEPALMQRSALLHDLAESITGDVSSPLKVLLPDFNTLESVWEHRLQGAFSYGPKCPCIEQMDKLACALESEQVHGDGPLWGSWVESGPSEFLLRAQKLGVPIVGF